MVRKTDTAIYARLSVENSGKAGDRDVITNQIEICKDFLASQTDLRLYGIYQDNGITGTVFDRPNFNRLMEDIKTGKIGCLIVRDLSRFGRDYIETGKYLERIFPALGLRFISVKEQYDSFNTDSSNESLMIPLQNMINALYSKDISRKVASAHKTRMSDGNFKKSTIAYGYKLTADRREIIVDEECAKFVSMMFHWKANGVKIAEIARKLDELNAPNPRTRKVEMGVRKSEGKSSNGWNRNTISKMLANPVYIGNTIVGRTEAAYYKGVKRHDVTNPELWKVIANTHEAIVSKEEFEQVQHVISHAKHAKKSKLEENEKDRNKLENLFENKIFCADCGKKMYFKKECKKGVWSAVYKCSSYARKLNTSCDSHYIKSEELNKKVLDAIKTQVRVALDYEKLIAKLNMSIAGKGVRDRLNATISAITLQANELQKKRQNLYESYTDETISENEYIEIKHLYDTEYENLNNRLEEAVKKRTEFTYAISSENKWITLMKSVSRCRKLNSKLVEDMIEEVRIYSDCFIEIDMKYNDIYALTIACVEELKQQEQEEVAV